MDPNKMDEIFCGGELKEGKKVHILIGGRGDGRAALAALMNTKPGNTFVITPDDDLMNKFKQEYEKIREIEIKKVFGIKEEQKEEVIPRDDLIKMADMYMDPDARSNFMRFVMGCFESEPLEQFGILMNDPVVEDPDMRIKKWKKILKHSKNPMEIKRANQEITVAYREKKMGKKSINAQCGGIYDGEG